MPWALLWKMPRTWMPGLHSGGSKRERVKVWTKENRMKTGNGGGQRRHGDIGWMIVGRERWRKKKRNMGEKWTWREEMDEEGVMRGSEDNGERGGMMLGTPSTSQFPAPAVWSSQAECGGSALERQRDGTFHPCWWNPQPFGDLAWSHCWEGTEIRACTGNRMGVGDKGL